MYTVVTGYTYTTMIQIILVRSTQMYMSRSLKQFGRPVNYLQLLQIVCWMLFKGLGVIQLCFTSLIIGGTFVAIPTNSLLVFYYFHLTCHNGISKASPPKNFAMFDQHQFA